MAEILVEQIEGLKRRVEVLETKHSPSTKAALSTSASDTDAGSKQTTTTTTSDTPEKLPKGVVLGKDGKPCRSCSSFASFSAFGKKGSPTKSTPMLRTECPADVEELGRSAWTVLHTMTANYPSTATSAQQSQMAQFLSLFSQLYPCWVCADDFRAWMMEEKNKPRLRGRQEFGTWMCDAHNEVNRKLGKKEFDCKLWEERWKDGWKDGRCD